MAKLSRNEGYIQLTLAERDANALAFQTEFQLNDEAPPEQLKRHSFVIPIGEFAPIGKGGVGVNREGVKICFGLDNYNNFRLFFENLDVEVDVAVPPNALNPQPNGLRDDIVYTTRHSSTNVCNSTRSRIVTCSPITRRNYNTRFDNLVAGRYDILPADLQDGFWVGNKLFEILRGAFGCTHVAVHFLQYLLPDNTKRCAVSFSALDNTCMVINQADGSNTILATRPKPDGDGTNLRPCPQYTPCQ